jgi:hypothetical protein
LSLLTGFVNSRTGGLAERPSDPRSSRSADVAVARVASPGVHEETDDPWSGSDSRGENPERHPAGNDAGVPAVSRRQLDPPLAWRTPGVCSCGVVPPVGQPSVTQGRGGDPEHLGNRVAASRSAAVILSIGCLMAGDCGIEGGGVDHQSQRGRAIDAGQGLANRSNAYPLVSTQRNM